MYIVICLISFILAAIIAACFGFNIFELGDKFPPEE